MPVSHYRHIGPVLTAVEQCKYAKSILDIGPGFGKYGVLLRERFDVRFCRYYKPEWIVKIDCIEIYPSYISPIHSYVYNKVIVDNILTAVDYIDNYDTIIFLECLEHLTKDVGRKLLPKLYSKCNKVFVVSFPRTLKSGAASEWPNPYEEHLSLWTKPELDSIIGETTAHSKTVFSKVKK